MEATTSLSPGQRDEVLRLLATQHHTASSGDLRALRVGSEAVRALTKGGVLTRVARGAYVSAPAFAAADPDERHRLTTLAVARTWPEGVAVSHTSAVLLWGLPLTARPERVHGSRTGAGQFRRAAVYTIHTGYSAARISSLRGAPVVEPAFAVLGALEQSGVQQAVVCGDAALHRGLVAVTDLERAATSAGHPSARRRMERAVSLMDGDCESAGETLARLLLRSLGYAVTSQVAVRTPDGGLVGRVDFLLDGTRVVVEFDGMVKYGERNALIREKRRELALQRAGYTVVRIVWSDLSRPDRVRELVEAAIAVDQARSA